MVQDKLAQTQGYLEARKKLRDDLQTRTRIEGKAALDVTMLMKELDPQREYLSKIEANLVPPPGDEKVLALAIALGRPDSDTQLLRDLADTARVPGDVVKDAVIRNPEVGALLRRLRTHRLTRKEADQLREIGQQSQPSDPEEPGPGQ